MKAMLEFDLPDESEEFEDAVHGRDYGLVIWETLNELRKYWKYGEEGEDTTVNAREIYNLIHDELAERGCGKGF